MWPDVSKAEVKIDGKWVLVERAFTMDGDMTSEAGQASAAGLGGTQTDVDSACGAMGWYKRFCETIVPAVRERWGE